MFVFYIAGETPLGLAEKHGVAAQLLARLQDRETEEVEWIDFETVYRSRPCRRHIMATLGPLPAPLYPLPLLPIRRAVWHEVTKSAVRIHDISGTLVYSTGAPMDEQDDDDDDAASLLLAQQASSKESAGRDALGLLRLQNLLAGGGVQMEETERGRLLFVGLLGWCFCSVFGVLVVCSVL